MLNFSKMIRARCTTLETYKSQFVEYRQQRLFTGALFPEAVNNALWRFARRHNLTSCVWAPLKLFDAVLKEYNIFVLPTAVLCDVTLTYGGNAVEVIQAVGADHMLVNAEHTSNTPFLEHFREWTTSILPTTSSENSMFLPCDANTSNFYTSETNRNVKVEGFKTRNSEMQSWLQDVKNNEWSKDKYANNCVMKANQHDYINAANSWQRHEQLEKFLKKGEMHVETLYNKRFCYPLSCYSAPFIDGTLSRKLLRIQEVHKYKSNYWIKYDKNCKKEMLQNADETEYAGRYNPTWSVHYYPHTYTNLKFPYHILLLMRQRAVEYGYVSRTWLTLPQAQQIFHLKLKPERANDAPCIYCNYFNVDKAHTKFYCADQFIETEHIFPTAQEIDLASTGVHIALKKLRGFPLLEYIAESCLLEEEEEEEYQEEKLHNTETIAKANIQHLQNSSINSSSANVGNNCYRNANEMYASNKQRYDNHYNTVSNRERSLPITSLDINDRIGADVAMTDAVRHIRFEYLTKRYDHIRLYGFTKKVQQERYLSLGFKEVLRRQCILRGFPVPFFVSSRHILQMGLTIRESELGIPQTKLPLRLYTLNSWLDGECWFNVSQLEESNTIMEMFLSPPVHFLTGERLVGKLMIRCCRHQIKHQCQKRWWVPYFLILLAGWKVKPNAIAIPHTPLAAISMYKQFRIKNNFFFNLDDVLLSDIQVEFIRRYRPVNSKGEQYYRVLRMAMTICALYYGYHSCTWVCYQIKNDKPFYKRRSVQAELTNVNFSDEFKKSKLFYNMPFVCYKLMKFINIEELASYESEGFVKNDSIAKVNKHEWYQHINSPSRVIEAEESHLTSSAHIVPNLQRKESNDNITSFSTNYWHNTNEKESDKDKEASSSWSALLDEVIAEDELDISFQEKNKYDNVGETSPFMSMSFPTRTTFHHSDVDKRKINNSHSTHNDDNNSGNQWTEFKYANNQHQKLEHRNERLTESILPVSYVRTNNPAEITDDEADIIS